MPLTDTAIRKAKPAAKPLQMADGGGLYLLLRPDGARWWRWDYRRPVTGKRNTLSLGTYPDVGLADARARRDGARKQIAAGIDGELAGPMVGACGSAAWSGQPVECSDIERDPRWQAYNAPFLALGIRACWSNPVKGHDGRVLGTFALYYWENRAPDEFHQRVVDVCLHLCALAIERDASRQRIHQLAFFDALTGLPNRAMFRSNAERALSQMERDHQSGAVLFVDLDRFKQVNDTQGHAAGDALLREVAQRLGECVRAQDGIGRLSGDEFVLLLHGVSLEDAEAKAKQIVHVLADTYLLWEGRHFPLTASIGLVGIDAETPSADWLLNAAVTDC